LPPCYLNQGIFVLSRSTLEALEQASAEFDFAALVMTADDAITQAGTPTPSARGNVLLETPNRRSTDVHRREANRAPCLFVDLSYRARRSLCPSGAAWGDAHRDGAAHFERQTMINAAR
jgi:Predicted nucleotide-binding protein containing TIR-like domain